MVNFQKCVFRPVGPKYAPLKVEIIHIDVELDARVRLFFIFEKSQNFRFSEAKTFENGPFLEKIPKKAKNRLSKNFIF